MDKHQGGKGARLTICMVSDFFYPNTGGVENHIYNLGERLVKRGHKVVVVTHAYGDRQGVCYYQNGLKVYYVPLVVVYNGCILPTVYGTLMLARHIIIKEKVDVVHGHSAFSALALEFMFHARMMGVPTVFTDHSLFGFADASSIIMNKLLQISLTNASNVICVSHTSKENTVLRAGLRPCKVYVIPNAFDHHIFTPPRSRPAGKQINIVSIGRLAYRKGIDLLARVIPIICHRHPEVNFIIGGDGSKRIVLEEMREKHGLQERVIMLGFVPYTYVREVLVHGHIFLNTSLTEAFCMTLLEAASCGLHVVATAVGGVPEVLPADMTTLTEPTPEGVVEGLVKAISMVKQNRIPSPSSLHKRVRKMYSWTDVAARTEIVYRASIRHDTRSVEAVLYEWVCCF